ncbi:MAG: hypothetical protein JXM70_23835 [Pirellulales bacterium]|nr:hypothetical protein [Pirellulales bacterium]
MPNPRKGLRPRRIYPAPTGAGNKRSTGRKNARRTAYRRSWIRALTILAIVALPLLAAAVAGPTIRGGSRWKGMLKGIHLGTKGTSNGQHADGSTADDSENSIGGRAEFGQVSVKLFNPVTRSRIVAEFDLEGVAVLEDGPELQKIIKNKYRFVREQATIAVRNSSAVELADPKLKLLERRVLIRINRSLERPLLKSVDLEHFNLCEATPELDLLGDEEEQTP